MVDVGRAAHGDRYRVVVDGDARPDPWSRWQPDGLDRPVGVRRPASIGAVRTGHGGRPARPAAGSASGCVYELHVGTFSPSRRPSPAWSSTCAGLADLGVTHVELMPVAQFPGDRGWGYDGVFWSATQHSYGGPAALVDLVDAAHEAGLGVVLDVVYNHIGPTGDQTFDRFGPFFTDRHHTPWGRAVNVDGPGSGAVGRRSSRTPSGGCGEIGVDGLRVDACHAIVDQSARHVLAELDRPAPGPSTPMRC